MTPSDAEFLTVATEGAATLNPITNPQDPENFHSQVIMRKRPS